jgi:hypothetical protein
MKSTALLLSAALLVGAYFIPVQMPPAFAQSAVNSAPDNTARNERDRDHQTLTPWISQTNLRISHY